MFFTMTDASCNSLRRLVVHEPPFNLFIQCLMSDNFLSLVFGIRSSYVSFVVGFGRIVHPPYAVADDLCRDSVWTSFKQFSHVSHTISFFSVPSDLLAVFFGELPPCVVFFSYYIVARRVS